MAERREDMDTEQGPDGHVWMTADVALPQQVLDALDAGNLVFFVGAGASVAEPSNLPLFGSLAKELARLARVEFDDQAALDLFLGSMPDAFDVHGHTRSLIDRSDSQPNSTHQAVMSLANASKSVRIVTTNFDVHLEGAAADARIDVPDIWVGPALPIGDDFEGVVHLHGSIRRPPRELVLTDRDFGRAYVTHAWATRFLLSMFQQFTVLFVGYSHDDPIMRYLALGLPSQTPRFALTDAASAAESKWTRLGVTPVGYPVSGHDHSALVSALQAWDRRARMGQLEHRARVREIVNSGPNVTPVDRDYLMGRIGTIEGATDFAGETAALDPANRVEWLPWIEQAPVFRRLFQGQDRNAAGRILARWFAAHFIADRELHGAALQTLQRLGPHISDEMFEDACWAADGLTALDASAGRRWKALLATSVPGHSSLSRANLLLPYMPGSDPETLAVLRAILRPSLGLRTGWLTSDASSLTDLPSVEIKWHVSEDALTRHLHSALQRSSNETRASLGRVMEDAIAAAYELLEAYYGPRSWDALSFGRSAIEPHEQDQFRDPIDAIIDGLREYGEKSTDLNTLAEHWWSTSRPLLQRLALHLVSLTPGLTGDQRLQWLLDRQVLYTSELKHEVYRLLAASVPSASEHARARLLQQVDVGPDLRTDLEDRDRHAAYGRYNLLVWLTTLDASWTEAQAVLVELSARHPTFLPREHPDLDRWMTTAEWGPRLPMEPDDFIRLFDMDDEAAIDELLDREFANATYAGSTWEDAQSLIAQVCSQRPDIGIDLWDMSDDNDMVRPVGQDVRRAIVAGWARTDMREALLAAANLVATLVRDDVSAHTIGTFLLAQVKANIDRPESSALARLRTLARELWREQANAFTHSYADVATSMAPLYLNSWPGHLAQYWMSEVDRRWRENIDDWSGLNAEERSALGALAEGPQATLDATRPAMAAALFFMFSADASFASERILPLFHNEATSSIAWNAYLYHPRYNDRLLSAGLLDGILVQWDRISELGTEGHRENFFGLTASIISFAGIEATSRQALLDMSVLADEGVHAASFAQATVRLVAEGGVNGAELWDRWLGRHLRLRLRGVPRTAGAEELAAWANALPFLGRRIPDAIDMLGGVQIALGEDFADFEIPSEAVSDHGLALVAHYTERILSSGVDNPFASYRTKKLIDSFRARLGDSAVQPMVEAARSKGLLREG